MLLAMTSAIRTSWIRAITSCVKDLASRPESSTDRGQLTSDDSHSTNSGGQDRKTVGPFSSRFILDARGGAAELTSKTYRILGGGSRGRWLGWLFTPLALQPISCYYYACDSCPRFNSNAQISFSRKHRPPQCSLASFARVPKVTPL